MCPNPELPDFYICFDGVSLKTLGNPTNLSELIQKIHEFLKPIYSNHDNSRVIQFDVSKVPSQFVQATKWASFIHAMTQSDPETFQGAIISFYPDTAVGNESLLLKDGAILYRSRQ